MITMCLFAMMVASLSVKAQEVTITLFPGWNWISYPNAVSMEISEALGTFTPMNGDKIKGQFSNSSYNNGYWRGGVTHFMPGMGYMYYSSRSEVTSFVFATTSNSIVETDTITDITAMSATVGSTVTIGEGNHVFVRGVCWSTEPMPDVDGSRTTDATVTGNFSSTLTGLISNTVYYVRAYVVTDYGLVYSEEQSFTTLDNSNNGNVPEGAINGLFSINADGDQVYFSQGNLQYIGSAATPYWKFADNQWDYLGTTTGQNSTNQNVDRDLFGWGTSGYSHGAVCYQPWSTSTNYSDYNAYGSYSYNLYDGTGKADWGYNAISNGGNQLNQWRTLTYDEWCYVIHQRSTISGIRWARGTVNGVKGIILFSDDWTISNYPLISTNGGNFSSNTISASDWTNIFENNGAIFLPAAGQRSNTWLNVVGSHGYYWSSSYLYNSSAYDVHFSDDILYQQGGNDYRHYGHSVRLVRDAE